MRFLFYCDFLKSYFYRVRKVQRLESHSSWWCINFSSECSAAFVAMQRTKLFFIYFFPKLKVKSCINSFSHVYNPISVSRFCIPLHMFSFQYKIYIWQKTRYFWNCHLVARYMCQIRCLDIVFPKINKQAWAQDKL